MKAAPILPPAPLNATCPLWMLCEWSEVFRNGLSSRSKVLLEVNAEAGPAATGERWLALVTWNLTSAHLRTALPPGLRREYKMADFNAGLDHRTTGEFFHQMKAAGRTVCFIELSRWGGAAIFIRKPANDPALTKLLTFNREGLKPRTFRLPRPRFYPKGLRQVYVERWAAAQKAIGIPAKPTIRAGQRQRGESPPRRRGQGGTPQA